MATSGTWKLRRYGRLIPASGKIAERESWKIFEAKKNEPEIIGMILDSGYFMVLQGQECLETIPLIGAGDVLKIHQKSENLLLRNTVKGSGRVIRMQFDGRNKAQAIKECSSAAERLREYLPVNIVDDDALPPNNQPPTDVPAPATQTCPQQGEAAEAEPEVVQGSLSIKRLAQNLLGEKPLMLPGFYRHASSEPEDLDTFVRVCLLDPSFPALVEQVEVELRKILEE
ncbi:meiotic recombination protein REC114 [Syngnathoides biaculeatus]|uniref:meiotic recombination protein REC114 n=1 Tax=Syngnathoides biaculeatus TaxID=300417 RepID=UPI002ADE04B8|nr:meiotic recombination protein REC114 [Syngnathoides biaculeatus]